MQTVNQNQSSEQFQGFWASMNLLDQTQRKEIIHQLLSELNSDDRAIISLFYFENLTQHEIASVMDTAVEYIENTLSSLIISLKDIVQSSEQNMNTLLH